MKRRMFPLFLRLLILMAAGPGVVRNLSEADPADAVPAVIKRTNGGEKWETKIDYADMDNWLAVGDAGKDVDVIYFYPTAYNKESVDAPDVSDIDDAGMRAGAQTVFEVQASVFAEDCNIYAPYYRQVSAEYALTLSEQDTTEFLRYSASQDPSSALDYYFEHCNNGKPFILAGHSQGSQIITQLLSGYMKEHPQYYKKMIAAYVIGYSVTGKYLAENPHLHFAERADDIGVIISYNTEGPGNNGKHNAVVTEGAVSINPLNWKRDTTYADVSENLGSLNIDGELVDGFADAQIDMERGVVVCSTADKSLYAIPAPAEDLFGPESYHGHDYGLYYANLRENVKTRIRALINRTDA